MADEQAALLAQIKALSGAIDQRRTNGVVDIGSSSSSNNGRGGYTSGSGSAYGRTTPYGRGARGWVQERGRGRGRGRGVGYASSAAPLPSRHRSLVLSGPSSSESAGKDGEIDDSAAATTSTASISNSAHDGWVKRKSTHNMSLVSSKTFEKTEPARLAALAASQTAKQASKSAPASSVPSLSRSKGKKESSIRRGDNMGEVIIDGVTFEFDETGTKLVKKIVAAPETPDKGNAADSDGLTQEGVVAEGAEDKEGAVSTPLRTSVNGQKFVRTKTGNMISQAVLDQRKENKLNSAKLKRLEQMGREIADRQRLRNAGRSAAKAKASASAIRKSKTLCAYFNKTGQCKNGLRCPYSHDPSRVAICPRFLRPAGCPLPEGTCPLSHEPRAERVPHCVHFLNSGACRNGEECAYVHPVSDEVQERLTNASPVCMQFSDFGWCAKGRSCDKRHTWDCPEFLRKGKCDRRACKLMHVVRNVPSAAAAQNGTRQLDDDELFVRDDDAFVQHDDEEEKEQQQDGASLNTSTGKRKRVDGSALMASTDEADEGEAEENGPVSFKIRTSKSFTGQNDYIAFDDEEEEDDDDYESEKAQDNAAAEGEGEEAHEFEEAEDLESDAGSVSSLDEEEEVENDSAQSGEEDME